MLSFRSVVLAVAASFATLASADFVIDPSSVPLKTRKQWCKDQTTTCPFICQQTEPGTTLVNECDENALTYGCICGGNMPPNVSEYSLTLPFHVCQQWQLQCADDCGNHNNDCIASCSQDNQCGARNPTLLNTTSTSTTVSPTSSPTDVVFTGPSGQTGDGTDEGAATVARACGMVVVAGSMFLGFFFML